MDKKADLGVFGGTGLYQLFDNVRHVKVETPYGAPSDRMALAEYKGRTIAFLPRHGSDHQYPPHKVPYRANVWAMKSLGVTRIIGPCLAGSLQADIPPGNFVVCDQFVDRTRGRIDTFYDGPVTTHVSAADPYCEELRQLAIKSAKDCGVTVHERGTVVVIQGPRFSTRSESRWFSQQGWEVINMTQYPECMLARELELCYVNISMITDFDAGLVDHPDVKPVTHEEVVRVFNENHDKLKDLIIAMIEAIPDKRSCDCGRTLEMSVSG